MVAGIQFINASGFYSGFCLALVLAAKKKICPIDYESKKKEYQTTIDSCIAMPDDCPDLDFSRSEGSRGRQ